MANAEHKFADVLDALRLHVDQHDITPKQLALWAGVDVRTIHYWLAGEKGGPSARVVNLWLQRLPWLARVDVATAQLAGSGLTIGEELPRDPMDRNGDGQVTIDDALDGQIEAMGISQDALEQIRRLCRDGMSADCRQRVISRLNETKSLINELIQTVQAARTPLRYGTRR